MILELDLTHRWEKNEDNQYKLVDEEKKIIYEPTIHLFKTIVSPRPLLRDFFKKNILELRELKEMCLVITRDTLNIIQKHIFLILYTIRLIIIIYYIYIP